jgi:hypothetical protein
MECGKRQTDNTHVLFANIRLLSLFFPQLIAFSFFEIPLCLLSILNSTIQVISSKPNTPLLNIILWAAVKVVAKQQSRPPVRKAIKQQWQYHHINISKCYPILRKL